MKFYLTFVTFCLFFLQVSAQVPTKDKIEKALQQSTNSGQSQTGTGRGRITYTLQVIHNDNQSPIKGMTVKAVEASTLQTVTAQTNENGVVTLKLKNGKQWRLSVGKMKNCRMVRAKPNQRIRKKETFVYDLAQYQRKKRQTNNRSPEDFKRINQSHISAETNPGPDKSLLTITVTHPDKSSNLPNMELAAVSIRDSVIYQNTTNQNGVAYFVLPHNTAYDIDINNLKNYYFYDPASGGKKGRLKIEFIPTNIQEKKRNDTIYQRKTKQARPSSGRALIKVKVNGPYEDHEKVYLKPVNGEKVYANPIYKQGYAYFLVPLNQVYLINMEYQKHIDAVHLKRAGDRITRTIKVNYVPNPRLKNPEKFVPTPKRLYVKDFNRFLKKQQKATKDKPFYLDIASSLNIHKASREALLKMRLSGSEIYNKGARARIPVNVGLILDKSGSMVVEKRAQHLKKALGEVGNQLSRKDDIAVTLFDDHPFRVKYHASDHMTYLKRLMRNYTPSGGTNIHKALQTGLKHLDPDLSDDRPDKMILLTDGYGSTPPKKVTSFVNQKAKKGIEFSAIGVGNEFNQPLLRKIARKGNGNFYYADDSKHLADYFLEELTNSFHYAVKDLSIDIYHNDKLIFSRLYGYPVSDTSKGHVGFDIGKFPASKNELAFLKFKLANPTPAIAEEPLTVKVSYYDLTKEKRVSYEKQVKLKWTDDERKTEYKLDREEKKLYAIAILNQTLKTMAEANAQGDHLQAKQHLEKGVKQIEGIFPEAKPEEVRKIFQKANRYIQLLTRINNN